MSDDTSAKLSVVRVTTFFLSILFVPGLVFFTVFMYLARLPADVMFFALAFLGSGLLVFTAVFVAVALVFAGASINRNGVKCAIGGMLEWKDIRQVKAGFPLPFLLLRRGIGWSDPYAILPAPILLANRKEFLDALQKLAPQGNLLREAACNSK